MAFNGRALVHSLSQPSQGRVTVWFVGAAFRGRAPILFLIATLSGRANAVVSRCRGLRSCTTVGICWRGLRKLHVDFSRRRGLTVPHDSLLSLAQPFGAVRRLSSLSRSFQAARRCCFLSWRGLLWLRVDLLIVAAFTGLHDSLVSLAQLFEAAHRFCLFSQSFQAARQLGFAGAAFLRPHVPCFLPSWPFQAA